MHWLVDVPASINGQMVLFPVALVALAGGLRDVQLIRFSLPQPSSQVPRYWPAALGPFRTTFLWGLLIGMGVRTQYRYATIYVLAIWILLSGDPLWGAGIFGLWGAVHGGSIACLLPFYGTERGRQLVERIPARSEFFRTVSGVGLLVAGMLLLTQTFAAPP